MQPTATTPSVYNLKGKAYQSYDEAGRITTPLYDFKGNLVTKIRNVLSSMELKTALSNYDNYIIDWTGLPSILDATDYQTDMAYDALNRVTELELPEDLDTERKKIIPTYNKGGALEKVDLYSPAGPSTTNYVENIAYNARGQRLLIAFGNNRMTRYAHDNRTFRLLRQRTEGYSKSTVGDTITYNYSAGTNKQDDGFNYDLVGNIMNIFVRVTDCGIGGTPDALNRAFEYDPIYRLTYADGRESDTQSGNTYLYDDAPIPSTPLPSNVNYYERNYDYDKLGNVLSLVQSGTNGFTRDYTYNSGKNTLQKIEDATPATVESYTYDNCGNTLTTNLNRYYVWNHADQLLCYKNQAGMSAPTVFTQYDYAGQDRVSKMVRTGTAMSPVYERTIYIDGIFEYVKLENGSTYEKNYIHIMDDKSRISEVRINPGTAFPGDIADDITYILEDQIGSSVVRLNTGGTIIDEEEYYPFGDSSLRTFTYKRYRYVGKERDAESGLYYYGARYYAAWTCRFISVDPLASKYAQLSPYNYASNNPIGQIDVDGLQSTGDNKSGGDQGSSNHITVDSKTSVAINTNEITGAKETTFTNSTATFNVDTHDFTFRTVENKYTTSKNLDGSLNISKTTTTTSETKSYKEVTGKEFNPFEIEKNGYLNSEQYKKDSEFQRWNVQQALDGKAKTYATYGESMGRGRYDNTVIAMLGWYQLARGIEDVKAGDNWGWFKIGISIIPVEGLFLASKALPLVSKVGPLISKSVYNSKLLGYNSYLFGIGRNGFKQGVLNQGSVRVGWSYIKNTHEHVFRIGIGNNSKYYPKTIIFGKEIHKHLNVIKTPATF